MDLAFIPYLAPLVPLLLAVLAPTAVRALPVGTGWLSAIALWIGAGFALYGMPDGSPEIMSLPWMPQIGVEFALRLTAFSSWFCVLILGLGGCIFLYTCSYFASNPRLPYLLACLALFTTAMLGIVLSDNVYLMFLFWEGTSLTSFLLVGFHDHQVATRAKAAQALLVTLLGGAFLLIGFILMHMHFGTPSIGEMLSFSGSDAVHELPTMAVVLVMLGAMTKSAQWPFHFWLPNAMAGPTPVSAFLHSATMVKAGVFLLALLAPLLAVNPIWTPCLTTVGVLTVVVSVIRAARADDMKTILASTTLSALGFLTVLAGVGTPKALLGFTIFLTAHALYKAPLFLAAGNLEKRFGSRDRSQLGSVMRHAPVTSLALAISVISLLGLPPFPGFLAKEYMLEGLLGYSYLLTGITALVAAGMVALGLHLWQPLLANAQAREPRNPIPLGMTIATLLPALAALALTIEVPWAGQGAVERAAEALGSPVGYGYALWHGFTPALGLSAAALVIGFLLWRWFNSAALDRPQPRWLMPRFEPAFDASTEALLRASNFVGRCLGQGLLGWHLAIIIVSLGIPTLIALAMHGFPMPELTVGDGTSALLIIGPLIAAAAIFAAWTRHTLTLLVSLGFVGLIIAFLFLWFSAPDLALTQLLAETLLLFLLAGVVYKTDISKIKHAAVPGRLFVAIMAGVVVSLMILKSMSLSWDDPVSGYHIAHSKSVAYGANVVNVILVDFRALDTLGEILVLGIAALGSTAALGAARIRSPLPGYSNTAWLQTGTQIVIIMLIPVAMWIFWRGHNAPGGGFIAALVAASAVGVAMLCRLVRPTSRQLATGSHRLILSGLSVALLAALLPVFRSQTFFTGLWLHFDDLHLGTPLLFDLGVFLTVLGFATRYLRHFQPNHH